ncbi:MAG: hypothetical protein V4582_17045 [Pseudomonadota bacterium]
MVACLFVRFECKAAPGAELSGLNPIPISREVLVAASKSQAVPNSKVLDQAWEYYKKWQGTWLASHSKPTAQERNEVVKFTDDLLEQLPRLAKLEKLGSQSIDLARLRKIMVVGSPEFNDAAQTANTQTLKALLLMGFTEHELDIADGVKIARPLILKMLARTPIDPDLYFLYARLSIDAQQNEAAWHAARTAAYLCADPLDTDLEFVGFVASIAAKGQWGAVKKMLREVASNSEQADRVIVKVEKAFQPEVKALFIPSKTP